MSKFEVSFEYDMQYSCLSRNREREFGRAYLLSDGRLCICLYDEVEPSKEYESMQAAKEDYTIY